MHVMVADGHERKKLSKWPIDHVVLPKSHNDIGSTPRLIGCYHAIGLGVDAIAFLDADNWYSSNHIFSLINLCKSSGASFASSTRMLCRPDGSPFAECFQTDPDRFIDTSCMLFTKVAFPLLANWVLMPKYGHLIGDRIMLYHVVKSGLGRAHSFMPTLFYRCGKEGIYRALGMPIPMGVQPMPNYNEAFTRWVADGNPPLI